MQNVLIDDRRIWVDLYVPSSCVRVYSLINILQLTIRRTHEYTLVE